MSIYLKLELSSMKLVMNAVHRSAHTAQHSNLLNRRSPPGRPVTISTLKAEGVTSSLYHTFVFVVVWVGRRDRVHLLDVRHGSCPGRSEGAAEHALPSNKGVKALKRTMKRFYGRFLWLHPRL